MAGSSSGRLSMYAESLPAEARKRYKNKLLFNNNCLPDPYELSTGWLDDLSVWPDLQFGDIYCYLIETPGTFTKENLKAYKSLEAYNFVTSLHVQAVYYNAVSDECPLCAMKTKVMPSQRINDRPHDVWVYLSKKEGSVYCAHCTCMAGLGEVCSHVAALLFKVELAVKLGFNKTACTDEACKWNQTYMKKLEVKPICEQLELFKGPRKQLASNQSVDTDESKLPSAAVLRALNDACPNAAFFTTIPKLDPDDTDTASEGEDVNEIPQLLSSLQDQDCSKLQGPQLRSYCEEIWRNYCRNLSAAQISRLQTVTTKQAVSPLWFEHRKGRVTGSKVHDVLHVTDRGNKDNLVRILSGCKTYDLSRVAAVKWGVSNEANARKLYISEQEKHHADFTCTQVGFIIDHNNPFLGASPDGVINCSCCGKGVLEIKCPNKHKQSSVAEAVLNDRSFFVDQNMELKRSHRYFSQVQLQMLVVQVDYCDLCVYTDVDLQIFRLRRDDGFCDNLICKTTEFFMTSILPELVTGKLQSEIPSIPDTDVDQATYCLCNQPAYGRMIKCANADCAMTWFHYECVNIKRAPRRNWFCLQCKSQ